MHLDLMSSGVFDLFYILMLLKLFCFFLFNLVSKSQFLFLLLVYFSVGASI